MRLWSLHPRYLDWKGYVEKCCYYTSVLDGVLARTEGVRRFLEGLDGKVQLDCMIYFANKKHSDPENARKGIQDAIFKNDKYVMGSVDFDYDKESPRVEVSIKKVGGVS